MTKDQTASSAMHRALPTSEELKAMGFEVLPPSGKGFIIPTGKRIDKPTARDAPPAAKPHPEKDKR